MDMSHSANMASYASPMNFTNSASIPSPLTINDMTVTDADAVDLSGEKKRNRLGYARTNMACGNCRKRKIRCLLVKDDGRCTQCIRLKKTCQFYAVDQGPVGAASRPLSQAMLALAVPCHPGNMLAAAYPAYGTPTTGPGPDVFLDGYGLGHGLSHHAAGPYELVQDGWAKQGDVDINASWRGYSPDPTLVPDYAAYGVPGSLAWTMETTTEPGDPPRPEDVWAQYQQPVRSMSFSEGHTVQYERDYDDRRASFASAIYHPTSMADALLTPYTTWQQPPQP